MAEYTFDKHMMAGERIDIAKAFNDGNELLSPFAVLMDGDFYTEKGLRDEAGLIEDWYIRVAAPNPKKSPTPEPTEFVSPGTVAYEGQGLKTGELTVDDFSNPDEGRGMADIYSYFPAGTGLQLMNAADGFEGLWHINSKGDYAYDGETFSLEENTESFTITWQDDIPDDRGRIVTGFVVRTTPHTEPER